MSSSKAFHVQFPSSITSKPGSMSDYIWTPLSPEDMPGHSLHRGSLLLFLCITLPRNLHPDCCHWGTPYRLPRPQATSSEVSAASSGHQCLVGTQTPGSSELVGRGEEQNCGFICLLQRRATAEKGGVFMNLLCSWDLVVSSLK